MTSSHPSTPLSPWVVPTALAVLYLSWGTTNLAIRIGVKDMPPFYFGGVRLVIAGTAILLMQAYFTGKWRLSARDMFRCAVSSTLLFVGGNGLLTCAMVYLESGLAAVVIAPSPIWMALMELAVPHGDRLTRRGWFGLLLGFLGIAILAIYKFSDKVSIDQQLGFLLASGSALVWSLGTVLSKYNRPQAPVWLVAGYQMLLGGIAMLITGTILGEPSRITANTFTGSALVAFLYLLIIGSLIGFVIYQFLLTNVSLALAGSYAYVTPVIALILGAVAANEEVPLAAIAALALTLTGVALIKMSQKKGDRVLEPSIEARSQKTEASRPDQVEAVIP
jgi:drug/metabolite transporter (DMT)-like permease